MTHLDHDERDTLIDTLSDVFKYPEHENLNLSDLERLTTEQLWAMVNREPVEPVKPAPDLLKPLTLTQALDLYPDYEYKPRKRLRGAPRHYKAQLRHDGENIYLGSFYTPVEAHAAVEAAKARRAIGLPVKL